MYAVQPSQHVLSTFTAAGCMDPEGNKGDNPPVGVARVVGQMDWKVSDGSRHRVP